MCSAAKSLRKIRFSAPLDRFIYTGKPTFGSTVGRYLKMMLIKWNMFLFKNYKLNRAMSNNNHKLVLEPKNNKVLKLFSYKKMMKIPMIITIRKVMIMKSLMIKKLMMVQDTMIMKKVKLIPMRNLIS